PRRRGTESRALAYFEYMTATRIPVLSQALRAVSAQAEKLCGSVSAEQLCRRPTAKSWSAAECLEHLAVSANLYQPVWQAAFAAAKQAGTTGTEPYRMDFLGRVLNWTLEPGRFKFSTPSHFEPVDCGSADAALADFLASQNLLLSFLNDGAGLP